MLGAAVMGLNESEDVGIFSWEHGRLPGHDKDRFPTCRDAAVEWLS